MLPTNMYTLQYQQRDATPISHEQVETHSDCGLTNLPSPLLTQIGEFLLSPSDTQDFRRFSQTCKTVHREMGRAIAGQSLFDKANIIEKGRPLLNQAKDFPSFLPKKRELGDHFVRLPLFDLAARIGRLNGDQLAHKINPLVTRLADHRLHIERFEADWTRKSVSDFAVASSLYHQKQAEKLKCVIHERLLESLDNTVVSDLVASTPGLWPALCDPAYTIIDIQPELLFREGAAQRIDYDLPPQEGVAQRI